MPLRSAYTYTQYIFVSVFDFKMNTHEIARRSCTISAHAQPKVVHLLSIVPIVHVSVTILW